MAKAEEKRKIGLNVSGETVSSLTDAGNTFVSDTSKKTGLSDRTIQQDLQLSKNLDSGVKDDTVSAQKNETEPVAKASVALFVYKSAIGVFINPNKHF